MNSMGEKVRVTLWGSSHGPYVGCVLQGVRGGLPLDEEAIATEMALRKPSAGIGTNRKEGDEVIIAAGETDGVSNGDPLSIMIANKDTRSGDYEQFRSRPRPGHADLTAMMRNPHHDIRGGGMFSGRMTAPLVAAGAICGLALAEEGIEVRGFTRAIGGIEDPEPRSLAEARASRRHPTRACDESLDFSFMEAVKGRSEEGDSLGGVVECRIEGLPAGMGEPWFDTLDGSLAKAMFSIPAMRAFEIGEGIESSRVTGSQNNDPFIFHDGELLTGANRHGGVLGGISSGMPLVFRCFFKPTPSISMTQRTVDLETLDNVQIAIRGRHDPCIVPRAVAAVEAMTRIMALDMLERGGFIGH